jgi:hypothetical protein
VIIIHNNDVGVFAGLLWLYNYIFVSSGAPSVIIRVRARFFAVNPYIANAMAIYCMHIMSRSFHLESAINFVSADVCAHSISDGLRKMRGLSQDAPRKI